MVEAQRQEKGGGQLYLSSNLLEEGLWGKYMSYTLPLFNNYPWGAFQAAVCFTHNCPSGAAQCPAIEDIAHEWENAGMCMNAKHGIISCACSWVDFFWIQMDTCLIIISYSSRKGQKQNTWSVISWGILPVVSIWPTELIVIYTAVRTVENKEVSCARHVRMKKGIKTEERWRNGGQTWQEMRGV